jgi:hypothetical protein
LTERRATGTVACLLLELLQALTTAYEGVTARSGCIYHPEGQFVEFFADGFLYKITRGVIPKNC